MKSRAREQAPSIGVRIVVPFVSTQQPTRGMAMQATGIMFCKAPSLRKSCFVCCFFVFLMVHITPPATGLLQEQPALLVSDT
jgi:hypothetical protein